jgi:membrane protein YqaA with SNARE-associated domain
MPSPASAPPDDERGDVPPPGPILARLLALADRPAGAVVLVVLALLEATIFPGPTEAMLLALTLGRPRRAWWFAGIATAASVVGGVIGYQLGATFFQEVARPVLATYGFTDQMDAVQRVYLDNMMLALVTSGYTPIPYMLYTMMAGASDLPLAPFVAGSFAGRALKYVPIAALACVFGPAVHRVLRRYGGVAAVVVVLAIVAWVLLRR